MGLRRSSSPTAGPAAASLLGRSAAPAALALAVVLALAAASLTRPQTARAAACASPAVTVTPMHSPDGTQRPFYTDSSSTSKHSGYVGYELSGASLGADVWIRLGSFSGGSLGLAANQSDSIPARATSASGNPLVYAYLTAPTATTTPQTFDVEVWNGKPGLAGSSLVCTASDGFSSVEDVIKANPNSITSISLSNSAPPIGGGFQVTAVGNTGTMGAGISSDQVSGHGVFSMAPAMDDAWPADAFSLTGVQLTMSGTTTRDRLRVYPSTTSAQGYTAVYSFTVRATTAGATSVLPVQNIASGAQVKYTGSYPAGSTQISSPVVSVSLVKSAEGVTGPPYHVSYQVVVSNSATSPVTLDYLKDTPTPLSGWTFDSGSATLGGAALPDPALDSGSLIFGGPFIVPARSGSTDGTLVFAYTLSETAVVTNAAVGKVGDVDLGATSGGNAVSVDPAAPVVTTGSLPDGTVGSAYAQTLAATGGSGSFTWSVGAGSLPAGLTLAPATGRISGTPTAAGTSSFTVTVTDGAGTTGSKALGITVAAGGGGGGGGGDTTAPTGSLTLADGAAATSSTTVSVSLSATDAVGVVGYRVAAGLDCSAATWVPVTSATSFAGTASVTVPAGDGTKTVCAQFEDAAGNVSTAATASIDLDTAAPSVSLSTAAPEPASGAFTVTATFSEAVTGFTAADVTVGNGAVSGLAGSGDTYTFTVTPAGDGTTTVDVGAGVALDTAGNGNTAATRLSRTIDATSPTVTLASAAAATVAGPFTVSATFSEPVSGLALADLTVGNGTASDLGGSGDTYTFTITPTAGGTVTVDLPAGSATDAAGNTNTAATPLSRTADLDAPTITLSTTAPATVNDAFTVTATFSETVTGFTAADVDLANGAVSGFSGTGDTYSFTVTPTADGPVTVDVAAAAAADALGHDSAAAATLSRTYDGTAPTLTLASAASDPTAGAFAVTATFSEAVTGFTAADLTVGNGTVSGFAGSGDSYSFTVTPTADGPVTLDVDAGAATDAAGNASAAAARLRRTVDTTAPGATLSSAAADPAGGAFAVTLVFSEPVGGLSLADVAVANGTASALAGSGASYTFTVTPAGDGLVSVDVAAGAATDPAGNASVAAAQLTRTADLSAPAVSISAQPRPTTTDTTATFSFAADEVATLECSLDGAAFTACTSPYPVSGLAPGIHTFVFRATDAAGNRSQQASTWTVVAPAATPTTPAAPAAPDVALTLRPNDGSGPAATFAWSGDGAFACSLDGAAPTPCSSPVSRSGLAPGPHTFSVRGPAGSAETRWTVGGVARPASVVIIPRIDPTDLLGRPKRFVQSKGIARSAGPFTRKLQVKLHVPTPRAGAERVFISNHADFRDQASFRVAADELYDWTLLAGPSGERRVFIRFDDAPDAPVGEATIVLDQELPRLRLVPLKPRRGAEPARDRRTKRPVRRVYCGSPTRRWLAIRGRDGFSGLNAVQIASNPAHPCAWRPFLPKLSYRLPGRVVYVRVEDRVGNIGRWYRLRTR